MVAKRILNDRKRCRVVSRLTGYYRQPVRAQAFEPIVKKLPRLVGKTAAAQCLAKRAKTC
jgi:hypothetical protein